MSYPYLSPPKKSDKQKWLELKAFIRGTKIKDSGWNTQGERARNNMADEILKEMTRLDEARHE